ncbi:DNA recombination protein RmuC [Neisseria iguanae]|uniref:DNA recombination protein RmuC n=1 Tax=Neisseria iguanae TaxID=90242 RepID=A0A2P7TWW3_9NEIS|nr:DNA recombination protein RmuC [Neisseria iguanae]PSJ79222.1 DNA recombination protein RmuC [Neisseria iguanae]
MSDLSLYLIATALTALLLGALVAWLLTRHAAQTQQFSLRQQLAERTQQHEFAGQSLARAEAGLADSRREIQDLHSETQELHGRFSAACKQIEYLQQREDEAGRLKQDYRDLQQTVQNLQIRNERLYTQIEQERQAADDKLLLLTEARQSLSDQFHNLANQILEEKSRRFSEQNREHLGQLLNPLNERLHGFSELVQNTYEKEARERLTLENELKRLQSLNVQLHHDAKALTDALTGTQNKTQGNWGEMILETVLENSGLQKGREYIIQAAATRLEEDGSTRRLQPDVLINLPDNKQIVIDAKVSLTAYTRYVRAQQSDEAARELAAHTASIRSHIKTLSRKDYTDLEGVNTLDFVFMFIPIEPAYLLALQHDGNLFQECFDKRIMLVGPSTLLATLRTVANIWRNEQQNQNALAIAEEGGRLYDKFVGFVTTLDGVGKNLEQAQNQFQTAYKQLTEGRGNLVNRAEKLRLLGVKAGKQLDKRLVENAQDNLLEGQKRETH